MPTTGRTVVLQVQTAAEPAFIAAGPIEIVNELSGRAVRTAIRSGLRQVAAQIDGVTIERGKYCPHCEYGFSSRILHLAELTASVEVGAVHQIGCTHIGFSRPRQLIVRGECDITPLDGLPPEEAELDREILLERMRQLVETVNTSVAARLRRGQPTVSVALRGRTRRRARLILG